MKKPVLPPLQLTMTTVSPSQLIGRGRKKKGNKSKAKKTPVQRKKAVNTTGMPVKGLSEKCPFKFSVYWHPNINRWFLPAEQQGSLCNIVDIFGASQNLFHCQLRLYLGMRLL
jgi:hypothetical protein